MSEKKLDHAILRQFTGSENWYRHGLVRDILFTDGVKYIADEAGAYWLIDEIALAQRFEPAVAKQRFQVWKLAVQPNDSATLSCEDGNGNSIFTKPIPFTDFPAEGIQLWLTDKTILLPTEY